ncbi:MAG TPA: DUF3788 family protein [Candidatus Limnocylindrales bacterium]
MAEPAFPDKSNPPSVDAFVRVVGPAGDRWSRLDDWVRRTYGVKGEPNFFGTKSGWTLRYRRSGKALFTLIPRTDGFSAMVVVGPTIWPATGDLELTRPTRAALETAHPYPDGRWAWFEVADDGAVTDVMRLVTLKSPPPKRRAAAAVLG